MISTCTPHAPSIARATVHGHGGLPPHVASHPRLWAPDGVDGQITGLLRCYALCVLPSNVHLNPNLKVEGNPPAANITHGGYGNAKRVGHDISPSWSSMISLVDIGAGLWPYAHGTLDEKYGGSPSDFSPQVIVASIFRSFRERPCNGC